MSTSEKLIDVYAAAKFEEQIIALAAEYQIPITDFEGVSPAAAVSTFPLLDPTVVEAVKQATLVVALGVKSVQFLSALNDLISKSKGHVRAVDRQITDLNAKPE